MNSEAVHKILEPYLAASAIVVLILLATAVLLWRDGRRTRDAQSLPPPAPRKDRPR